MMGAGAAYVVMGIGLLTWVLTGGADYGGGVWDLLATGPRKHAQRRAIETAIAPIWEANHVWLIFVIVLMFTAFPRGFSAVGIALHVPLVLGLVGMVLRGTAFTFRAYGLYPDEKRRRWGRVFGWSSLFTPVLMGTCLAAVASGEIRVDARVHAALAAWLSPFAVGVGVFSLALFALLAATYLTLDTAGDVREDFRKRALVAEGVAGVIALFVFWRAHLDAPLLFDRLGHSAWTWPLQGATAVAAGGASAALFTRRFRLARAVVVLQIVLVVAGFGAAMGGAIVMPDITIENAGTRDETIAALVPVLVGGVLLLAPALFFLFRVFKRPAAHPRV